MIDYFFSPAEQTEARNNHLAQFIEEAALRFYNEDVDYLRARCKLRGIIHFGNWLRRRRVSVEKIDTSHVKAFLSSWPELPLNRRVEFGRQRCAAKMVVAEVRKKYPKTDKILVEVNKYLDHLRFNRGLSEASCDLYKRHLTLFLSHFFKRKMTIAISSLTQCKIRDYCQSRIKNMSVSQAKTMCGVIRGYFRFHEMNGTCTRHLTLAVPSISAKRRSLSRTIVTSDDLEKVLSSIDRSTFLGKRTYASILCLSDLGMRIGDVAKLSLDDINWRNGTIIVENKKSERPFLLPLPKRVGAAIADYIRGGRPKSDSRDIFLSAQPLGSPITKSALYTQIQNIWIRTGLDAKYTGTHVFRHSMATNLRRKGLSLKVIADVLGHQSLETTALYAQLDIGALRQLAQAWPKTEVRR